MQNNILLKPTYRPFLFCLLFMLGILLSPRAVLADTLTFNFNLDAGYTTSGGAYKPDGTLVKTLWRKVYYSAGPHSYTWDGIDDNGAAVPAGNYQLKMVAHNMQYVWDGSIANTSQSQTTGVHSAFYPMADMAISGQNAFYVSGYNEARYACHRFDTSNPQVVTNKWMWRLNPIFNRVESIVSNVYDRSWKYTATDGTRAYFGVPIGTDPSTRANTYPGFITASFVSDSSLAAFSAGSVIPEGPTTNWSHANGIYAGTQPGLSGLAVQSSGSVLAASVAPDNKVYLFDKVTGAATGSITVTTPGRIEFAPNGDLWVVTGTSVERYTLTASPGVWTLATTISGFSKPLDVGVHPSNNNIVMVVDGGTSQQVKAYNSTGTPLWTFGQAGGYQTGDATVADDKFWFLNWATEDSFISIQDDGSFWLGDGGNQRNMHFSSSRAYIDQIAYTPHSYSASVDRNNGQRVFSDFLEYNINYGAPAGTGWNLVKNWGAGLPPEYFRTTANGLQQVTTLSNGRTYAKVRNNSLAKFQIVELDGNTTRVCATLGTTLGNPTLTKEGDIVWFLPNIANWSRQVRTGFDGSNNPVWAAAVPLASATNAATDPAPRCCGSGAMQAPLTSSNVVVSYDTSKNNGFHLGGVSVGGTSWLWKAMPAVTNNVPIDGLGSYGIGNGVNYAGSRPMTNGRHIVAGYHGEGWNQGQAAQFMHFLDNGLFIGQFGVPGSGQVAGLGAIPGFAGNAFSPELVRYNNELYMWTNDESAHGPQRWHLIGVNSIREYTGSGTLGGSAVNVTPIASTFPTGIASAPGNGLVRLTWNPVAGASSYTVKYSTSNGGPYTAITGVPITAYTVSGLTNGTIYYFTVSATVGGVESANSDQVKDRPYDSSAVVQIAGEQSTIQPTYNVSSTAPANEQPALTGLDPTFGNLSLHNIGSKGYVLFNYNTAGNDVSTVQAPFTVTKGTGWRNDRRLTQQFTVDGVAETDSYGLFSNPVGTINISTTDSLFHYLTVFSPSQSGDKRGYTLKLTPQGSTTPVASYVVPAGSAGIRHTYQFVFKGNVTLTVDSTGGAVGTVKAIFLDNVAPHGLKAEYYNGMAFNTLLNTVTDPNVNFDWGLNSPMTGVPINGFSTRWTGTVQAIESGTYTFTTTSDDGAKLWVDNTLLVDKFVNQGTTSWSGTINLVAGQKYPIKMEYFENGGGAIAKLSWTRPGMTSTIIPTSQLFPAS